MGMDSTCSAAIVCFDEPLQLEGEMYTVHLVSNVPWGSTSRSSTPTLHPASELAMSRNPTATDTPPAKASSFRSDEVLVGLALNSQGSMLKRRPSADDLDRHAMSMTTAKSRGQSLGFDYTWAPGDAIDKAAIYAPDMNKRSRKDRCLCFQPHREHQQL